jgi:uncharacterized protein (TIGR00251 family)
LVSSPITEAGNAVRINIYVQPRASRTELVGLHGDAIKLRVAAPPVEGEANVEVARFLARTLGVANNAVQLVSGESARRKVVEVSGISVAAARSKLLP